MKASRRYRGVVAKTMRVEWAPASQYGFFRLESIAPLEDDAYAVGNASGPAMIANGGSRGWHYISYPSNLLNMPLTDVQAFGPSDIWAVGYQGYRDYENAHIAHYDGRDWSQVASPNATDGRNRLHGIDGRAADDIWTVGAFAEQLWGASQHPLLPPPHGPWQPLTVHWDGASWIRVSCDAKPESAYLVDVTAVPGGEAWAVGTWVEPVIQKTEALVMHWTGRGWEQVMSPTWRQTETVLWAVDSVAADDVWAVGEVGYPTGRPFAMHWDGSVWAPTSVPGTAERAWLSGVAIAAPNEVWAVGTRLENWDQQPLAYVWNGQTWREVQVPRKGGKHWLTDAAITASGDVIVSGSYTDPPPNTTYTMPLVLRVS